MTKPAQRVNRHREWMDGYYQERERHAIEAENASLGYTTEYKEWIADHPIPTLREWMKHREKAPEMVRQTPRKVADPETATDAERLANWNRPAEQQYARGLQAVDRWEEDQAEAAEQARYEQFVADNPLATVQQMRDYYEQSLLGSAMQSDAALPALQAVRDEFSQPFHGNVARAILDQAADGAPHDSASVEAVLRERKLYDLPEVLPEPIDERPFGPYYPDIENANQPNQQYTMPPHEVPSQLPSWLDPDKSLVPADQVQYGLRSWEQSASPDALAANGHAVRIREYYRGDYLEQVAIKLQERVQFAREAGEDPGYEMLDAAQDLVNVPPKLDYNLQPTNDFISRDAVDTDKPVRVVETRSEATTLGDLGLPPKPVLSSVPKVAASA